MSLMDILRRRQPRSFSNQLSEASLPTGEMVPADMPELDAVPLEAQQLQLLAALMQGVQADAPALAPAAPRARSAARVPAARLALTDFERELTSRPMLPGTSVPERRPAPTAPRRPAPEGTLLEQMLRDPGSQRLFRAAQREINEAPMNMARDYATAAVAVPVLSRVARAGGPAIEKLKQFLRARGLTPADELAQSVDDIAGLSDEAVGELRQLELPLAGGRAGALGRDAAPASRLGAGGPRGQLELPFDENLAQRALPFLGPEDALPTQSGRTAALVDDLLEQLRLPFNARAPRAPRAPRASKTPAAPEAAQTKAAVLAPRATAKSKADLAAMSAEKQRVERLAKLKAAGERAKGKAAAPEKETTFVELPSGYLSRGGTITRVPMGVSGVQAPPAPPVRDIDTLQDILRKNVNSALGQRDARRRASQLNRLGVSPIIAAILGGQSVQQ